MITSLTKEQEARIPEYVDKWIGYASSEVDFDKARSAIERIYGLMKKDKPVVLIANGPIEAFWSAVAIQLLCKDKKRIQDLLSGMDSPLESVSRPELLQSMDSPTLSDLSSSLNSCLFLSFKSALGSSLFSTLDSFLFSALNLTLNSALNSALESALNSSLNSSLDSDLRSALNSSLGSSLYSSLNSSLDSDLRSDLDSSLYLSLGSSLYLSLGSSLYLSLGSSLDSSLGSSLDSSLGSSLYSSLYSSLVPAIKKCVGNGIEKEIDNAYKSLMVPQWWGAWAGYYDYAEMIGVKFDKEAKGIFQDFCQEVPLIYCLDKLAIICHKPEISWQKIPDEKGKLPRRILHNSTGPAIKYRDGYEIYCLNNVVVPDWLVKTDAGKLDVDKGLALKNADQKAEFVRKYGIDRLKKRGKVVDSYKNYDDEWITKSEYELIDMSPLFKTLKYAPYLSMKNQSVPGVYHMEGVHPSVKTIQDAVDFRSKTKKPKIIDIK